MSEKQEGVCSGRWNEHGSKDECVEHCQRLENYQYNKPWYHIPPYGMEQKEEVTITAPIKSDGSPLTPFGIKLKIDAGECFLCESKGNRRGFCTKHFDRWRKGYLEHPVEGLWKPNRKSSPRKKVKMFDKKTIQAIVQNLDAAVKSIEGRKDTRGKVDYSCVPMETITGVARVFEKGKLKYGGSRTWMDGIKFSKLCSAIIRHTMDWFFKGLDKDEESGEHPLSHIIANAMMLLTFINNKKYDDRPNKYLDIRSKE